MPGDGKRRRKGMIWARDGGGAEKHPAYFLEADDGAGAPDVDANDNMAWIEWATTGAVVQIPKSQIASPLASRRSRTAGRVAKSYDEGAPSQASDDSDRNEVTVHLTDGGDTHASKPAVPSPVASAFMGGNGNNCYDYDTDDDNAIFSAAVPSPVFSRDVKLEDAFNYDTDEEQNDKHHEAPGAPRPSPVRSVSVKTEEVYKGDTDEEDEGRRNAGPIPGVSFETDSSTGQNLGGSTSTYPPSRSEFIRRLCDNTAVTKPKQKLSLPPGEVNWIQLKASEKVFLFAWDERSGRNKCFEPDEDTRADVWWVNERTGEVRFLPKQTYDFWSTLYECKTWGEVRVRYDRGFYLLLLELYATRYLVGKADLQGKQIADDKPFQLKMLNPMFEEHRPGMHDTFPPCIEQLQLVSHLSRSSGGDYEPRSFGHLEDGCLYFDAKSKNELVGEDDSDWSAKYELIHEPGLAKFPSMVSTTTSEEDTLILIDYCCANWVPEGMTDNHSFTLATMPAEVIGGIFSFLCNDRRNVPAFHAIEQTCRSFQNLFGNDEAREMLFPGTSVRDRPTPVDGVVGEETKKAKRQWASALISYCKDNWRPPSGVEQSPTLTNLPGEVMGEILCYLGYDAENLPTMLAVEQTCKAFNEFFAELDDFQWLLLPCCVLVPFQADNAGKLNLWRGELADIKCGSMSNHLSSWRDMKKRSKHVKEFVWWANERAKTFLCLPKETYTFWSTINECKTWGDIRAKYTKGFYEALMSMYWEHNDKPLGADDFICSFSRGWRFLDTKEFDVSQLLSDYDMTFGDDDNIPPGIEFIQSSSLRVRCYDLLKPFGDWVMDFHGDRHVKFEGRERDEILAAIKASGSTARYEPGLSQFWSIYS